MGHPLPESLSPSQVSRFHATGYLILPACFSRLEIEAMRAAFQRLEQQALALPRTGMSHGSRFVLGENPSGRTRIERIVWCGAAEPVLLKYGSDDRLLRPAAQLLGSRTVQHLINQAHYKRPGDGLAFPWHQDSTHRRFGSHEWRDVNGSGSYVQTITALDDMTRENGALHLIDGSHRLGHLDWLNQQSLPPQLANRAVPAVMAAGSVLLFGPYTIHSSPPNHSAGLRRAFINGFAHPAANRRVYPGRGAGRLLSLAAR